MLFHPSLNYPNSSRQYIDVRAPHVHRVTSMWDGWGQQHEVHFEDTFQSPEVGLLNVFIS
jgi:hypothetical protein